MYCELFALLEPGVLVLSANQRLASHLHQGYHRFQQQKGLTVWQSPAIFPLTAWLAHQWQHNDNNKKKLLNEYEETLLWQNIIRANPGSDLLLQIKKTAQLAKQAWQTLTLWQMDSTQLDAHHNQDIEQFILWAEHFQQTKKMHHWLCTAELSTEIVKFIHSGQLSLPKTILTVGFDDLSPAIETLFHTLQQHSHCYPYQPQLTPHTVTRVELKDEEQEIRAMAWWAKEKYRHHHPHKIACIVPNLNNIRGKVAAIFTEIFCQTNLIPGHSEQDVPFNISAGTELIHVPMINSALIILKIVLLPMEKENLQAFFLSPYINSTTEDRCLAAMVAREMMGWSQSSLTNEKITALITELTQHAFPHSQLLLRWQMAFRMKPHAPQQHPQQWAEYFNHILQIMHWPGLRHLTSYEYQVLQCWQQQQLEFAQLELLFPTMEKAQAIAILSELCLQTIFQPKSNNEPIQILGVLEASGSQFEHIWLMGLDDESWPPKAEPNPFIPIELQRTHAMPHASAQRELRYCQQIQQRLCQSAHSITLSSAQQQGDKQLLPSPLIKSITKKEWLFPTTATPLQTHPLENICDDTGPLLTDQEKIEGGSWILQQQALCPFRAFASIRLKALPIPENEIGLSAAERGIFCHQSLESVWKKIKTQQQLNTLPPEKIDHYIHESITLTTTTHPFEQNHYFAIEQQRLKKIITAWLEIEKTRPPFAVIERETKRHIQIGKLSLRIQIDRIDELMDGQQLVIDYKTSKQNSLQDWLGERLIQPQLPIYCLYGSEHVVGIAFAEVNLAKPQFKGIIDQPHTFSKIIPAELAGNEKRSWQQHRQYWQQALEQLSDDFCQGKANVDPESAQACQFCELHTLCRIGDFT
ncbi:MAG: hypothetical protein A3F10_06685 [Coxiella sp. RIFCSPHIGHO2_12_FULL_42_15]|nr:MAG: hypothetical protein A3F10_06685 [Coxiella sp. RIFCSPHIGHO2_12_FULL_42_15]